MELLISIKYSYSYVHLKFNQELDIGYYIKCIRYGPVGYSMGEDKMR